MNKKTLLEALKTVPPSHFIYLGTDGGGGWFFAGTAEAAIEQLEQKGLIPQNEGSWKARKETSLSWSEMREKEVVQSYHKTGLAPFGVAFIVKTPTPIDGFWTYEEYLQANNKRTQRKENTHEIALCI